MVGAQGGDRRRFPRRNITIPLVYLDQAGGGTCYQGSSLDLSPKGLFIEGEKIFPVGASLAITAFLPILQRSVSATGSVVRITEPPRSGDALTGMGVELSKLEGVTADEILELMREVPPIEHEQDVQVLEVKTREDLEQFIRFPWRIYQNDPRWVPPLVKQQRETFDPGNPFFEHAEMRLFLARVGGEPVGRIAAIVDHDFLKIYDEPVGYFGYFESVPNFQVARVLLRRVEEVLIEKGMQRIRGPISPSLHDEIGFLIEGYKFSPSLLMSYNPPYYPLYMERYGLKKAKDFYAFTLDLQKPLGPQEQALPDRLERQGIRFRPLDTERFDRDLEVFRHLYNRTFSGSHAGWFVPITPKELKKKWREIKRMVDPELIWFAEAEGRPVGVFLNLPDPGPLLKRLNGRMGLKGLIAFLLHAKGVKDVRAAVIGVLEEFAGRGIASALMVKALQAMQRRGYRNLECSWVMEDNVASQALAAKFGGTRYKTYRVYEKELPDPRAPVPLG